MRPARLKPFDILLYRNHGILGDLIGDFEKETPGDCRYSHVAMVFNDGVGIEQNPPCAHVFPLGKVPWQRVDVYRLRVRGKDVFDSKAAQEAAWKRAEKFLGPPPKPAEPYDFGFIGKAMLFDIMERVGLAGMGMHLMHHFNSTRHESVCSTTAEAIAEAGLRVKFPRLELRPRYIGEGDMRPSDWPRSGLVHLIV